MNRERARCTGILERAIAVLVGKNGPGPDVVITTLLADYLERIRRPWRVRLAARKAAVPGRRRRCCGICGGEDHTAPRHRSEA